jgi:chromosome segregation ATPase
MDKNDINNATSNLNQAINFFSPMVVALNGAEQVFSVLANAVKHKELLVREVDALKKSADDLKAQEEASALAITANDAAAVAAKAAALQEIADAQQQAQTQVKEILESVATSTKAAKEAFSTLQADIAAQTEAAQKAYADEIAAMSVSKQEMETTIKTLETKLDKLKEQAKKFAASLTIE